MKAIPLPPKTTMLERKMCGAKRRYPREECAKRAKQRLKDKYGDIVNVYLCPFCHFWHIGGNHTGGDPEQ